MKLRFGLFLAASITVGVIAAACSPKQPDNGGTLTPTPTQTGTATGTATPIAGATATPGIVPVYSWVTPDGEELWLAYETTGEMTAVVNIATRATACTDYKLALNTPAVAPGALHYIRFDSQDPAITPNPLVCDTGSHEWWFDWTDADGGCTQGCVTDVAHVSRLANSVPSGHGPVVFSKVDVYDDPNSPTPALLMLAKDDYPIAYDVTEERFYDSTGNFVAKCDVQFTTSSNGENAVVQICPATPTTPKAVVPGNYEMLFQGTMNGADYYEYIPFVYHQGFPP